MLNRIWLIASHDYLTYLRRPMVWVWVFMLGLMYWGLSQGNMQIATGGDSMIGGTKQHLTSEFEMSRLMAAFTMIIHGFFATVLFGMAVIRDYDTGTMPLLHSSKLTPLEYLIAKFTGCAMLVLTVLLLNVLMAIFFMYGVPDATRVEYFGPFTLQNFVYPTVKFVLPAIALLAGLAFVLGTITRKPVLVFSFPLIFLLVFGLFLNSWSPLWLPTWVNNVLCMIDPYGTRWMNETYFNVDRGADFYNTQPVVLGTAFMISRVAIAALGFLAFAISVPWFRRQLRGSRHGSRLAVNEPNVKHSAKMASETGAGGLASLEMEQNGGGVFRDTWNIMRYELKELRHSPSMYLFVPFIIIEVIGTSFFREGAFGTPLLHTSGTLAEGAMTVLAILGCLLMMFFTVESQMRERIKKLAPIYYSTRARSFAMLLGKSVANTGVCVVIMSAALLACLVIMLVQGTVSFEIFPFTAYWLLLLMPTFLLWGAFITLVIVLSRSRYTTYGVAAAVLLGTLYLNQTNKMTWLNNWMLTGAAPWSDIAVLEMDRSALWLNRLFALSLAVLFTWLSAKFFWRRGLDPVQMATRFKPGSIGKFVLRSVPYVILPIIFGLTLLSQLNHGFQGKIVEDMQRKYWRQNFSTWANTKPPAVSGVDVTLDLDPAQQSMKVDGILRLTNDRDEPIKRFALSTGSHWKNVTWKLGDTFRVVEQTPVIPSGNSLRGYEPEDRSGLVVFSFDPAIEPGESTTLGYSFHGKYPDGISKNGGGAGEFVLPSGVVLTSFSDAFVPAPGFDESAGLDEDNQPESKVFEDDFFEEELKPLFGGGDRFYVRTTITGPESFTFNGVGIKKDEHLSDGRKTVVWESDSPVSFFNVVGGRWKVYKGETTEIWYNEQHDYNVKQISEAVEAARAWYSRWFAPYPWKDLRVSEFPNMSSYAQGFATNITFSEGIGFLTKDKPGADLPFMVAAHETAHQWWGNILVPGQGPGGNILSEGMAHFSTCLLFEQVKGERARIDFLMMIEDRYGKNRSVDSEKPMVKIDGSRRGDTTVMYDKGGWVFWMLLNHMGRTENLQGIQSFIKKYSQSKNDYPVLQDFVNHMRNFSTDEEAFDQFVDQWFFDVVIPQYQFSNVKQVQDGTDWIVTGSVKNVGTGLMPLEICAALNERFVDRKLNNEYQDARSTVTLGANESSPFEIRSSFRPDRVLVDPDARVLQLKRKLAIHKF